MGKFTEEQLQLASSLALERSFVLGNTYLTDKDAAFAGGGFVEGLGSEDADVDIYAIRESHLTMTQVDAGRYARIVGRGGARLTARDREAEICRIYTLVPGTSIKLGVHYRTWDELNGLTIAIHLLHEAGHRNPLAPVEPLPLRDLLFLHRLYTSHDIQGADRLARVRQEIGRHRFLHLLYRRKACSPSLLGNLLHAWGQGAWGQCAALAHEMAIAHFQAYTHLLGNTHYHPVWILPYARYRGVPESMVSKLVRIMVDKESSSDEESRRFVGGCLDFVDEVLAAMVTPLSRISGHSCREAACAALEIQLARQPHVCPEWEAVYYRKVYGMNGIMMREWLERYGDAIRVQ
ncbi:hypothetical protein [Bordetella genomosp. 11]|uniref:Nucleotidyltransferase n=1 Tax=Bordetella genomosp. 11 TaxID=1416808 RepID=A0A261UY35_9BORD|nr:hypothetical protein [Bordetella genomosp. 11]OZI66511.1 hypothetical protein CAL28_01885 [Bordetella genomosp. 11]